MTDQDSKTTPLFDRLYAAGKVVFDEAKKPLVRGSIKRKLHAAMDDAQGKINEANLQISKTRESFDTYDINKVLEQKAIITKCLQLQEEIKGEYKELFGKDMPQGDD